MIFPEIVIKKDDALELEQFKEMDYYAVTNYNVPIELMMENAGLHLASLVANFAEVGSNIRIGVGNGNNGGGGLVAARRLCGWGYNVYLDIISDINKNLPSLQLDRAIKFGASLDKFEDYQIWVDAYLGFSQRLPLPEELLTRINEANGSKVLKISLDIPSGFQGIKSSDYFKPDKVLTLAAPKKLLYNLDNSVEIFIADIGIPGDVYSRFEFEIPSFNNYPIIKLKR